MLLGKSELHLLVDQPIEGGGHFYMVAATKLHPIWLSQRVTQGRTLMFSHPSLDNGDDTPFPKAPGSTCHFRMIKNLHTFPTESPAWWSCHCKRPFPWPPMWHCSTWPTGCRDASTPAGPLLRSASSWDLRGGSLEVRQWPFPIALGTDLEYKQKEFGPQAPESECITEPAYLWNRC